MSTSFEAFFADAQPGPLGRRLCLWHAPAAATPKAVLVQVHAFAEEMNKSRRMVALQSRALAAAGYAVLQIDLMGCGDSAGEFGDASWAAWIDDVLFACDLAQHRAPQVPMWLWGHRAGCLLASAAAERCTAPCNLLMWQPTVSGKSVLQQFLRLEAAGALLGKAASAAGQPGAKALLASGQPAQVAGYELTTALTTGLEAARLQPPASGATLLWLDLAASAEAAPSPAAASALQAWAQAGWATQHHSVIGPSFWQTTEIEEAPALISTTLSALQQAELPAPAVAAGALV